MIEVLHLLPVLMVARQPKATPIKNRPSAQDIRTLRDALKKVGTFDAFLEELKAIRYEDGEMIIQDPSAYSYWNDVHSYVQTVDWYDFERTMKLVPEEKEKFMEMVRRNRPNVIIKKMPAYE